MLSRRSFLTGALAGGAAMALGSVTTRAIANGPGPTSVFDVRGFGARGDGSTDDTRAIRAAAAAACAQPGSTLYLPAGTYRMDEWQHPGITWSLLGVAADGLTIAGDGPDATVLRVRVPPMPRALAAVIAVNGGDVGWQDRGGFDGGSTTWLPSLPVEAFAQDSLDKGATELALANPEAFAPGDWVYVRTGQTIPSGNGFQPDSEINQITAMAGGTATLRWPLSRDYRPERYPGLLLTGGMTSVDHGGEPAPFGISRITDRICHDVTVRDLGFDAPVSTSLVLTTQCVGARLANLAGTTGLSGYGCQWVRSASQESLAVNRVADDLFYPGWAAGYATGSVDVTVSRLRATGEHPMSFHVHEGVAQGRFDDIVLDTAPNNRRNDAGISFRGRAYDCTLTHARVATGSANAPIVVDETCVAGGVIDDVWVTNRGSSDVAGEILGRDWQVRNIAAHQDMRVASSNFVS